MLREMLRAKVHRATVTETNVDYEGSLTLDAGLMKAAGLIPYERIDVYNADSGARFSTYLISGAEGSGVCCINGAAAHLARPGDRVIIASYASVADEELRSFRPTIVLVGPGNRIKEVRHEIVAGTVVADA
ncbi:MAG TPA: aspartate 1-decarboxylase [Candidatus Polarisedimenticolia bacterium]|nr:aspartate 1-decarboxylase [Candidatus Polarisedimenticolia bacterium]